MSECHSDPTASNPAALAGEAPRTALVIIWWKLLLFPSLSRPGRAQSRQDKYLRQQSKSFGGVSTAPPCLSRLKLIKPVPNRPGFFLPLPVNPAPCELAADITLITLGKIPLNLEKFRPLVPAKIMTPWAAALIQIRKRQSGGRALAV